MSSLHRWAVSGGKQKTKVEYEKSTGKGFGAMCFLATTFLGFTWLSLVRSIHWRNRRWLILKEATSRPQQFSSTSFSPDQTQWCQTWFYSQLAATKRVFPSACHWCCRECISGPRELLVSQGSVRRQMHIISYHCLLGRKVRLESGANMFVAIEISFALRSTKRAPRSADLVCVEEARFVFVKGWISEKILFSVCKKTLSWAELCSPAGSLQAFTICTLLHNHDVKCRRGESSVPNRF